MGICKASLGVVVVFFNGINWNGWWLIHTLHQRILRYHSHSSPGVIHSPQVLHVDSDGLDVQTLRCYGYIYITSLHVKLKAPLDTVYYGYVAGKTPRQLTSFLSSGSFFERTCPWNLLNSGSSRPHSVPPFLDPVVGVRYVRVRSGGFSSKDFF